MIKMKKVEKENEGCGGGERKAQKDQSWIPKMIKKRVCTNFVEDSCSNGALCQCGGARDLHASITADDHVVGQWDSALHTSDYPTDAFGQLEFVGAGRRHCPFLRLSCDTPPDNVYSLMTSQWGLPVPNLVVSMVGGEEKEMAKPWVREVIRQGLVHAAQSTGAWIMTSGLKEGVSRCVGEAVRHHCAMASSLSQAKVIAVGVAPWGLIYQRQQLVNPQGSFPARYYVHNMPNGSSCLDNNHQAFLLVDDGSVGHRGSETSFRANLEDFISHQRTGIWGSGSIEIPVLCVLIAGDSTMLEVITQRVDLSLKNSTPWLVLAGSGSAADLIAGILKDLSAPLSPPVSPTLPTDSEESSKSSSIELRDRVTERIKKHFPSETELDKLVDQALSIYHNRDLITIFHGDEDGSDDFDTIILKALVRAAKRDSNDASEYTEELKLAVAWNRVDIAKTELFNGDVHWKYEDLEESMTDALVNNKPDFVRLFVESGLNILAYLTYHRLESLYSSLSDCDLVSSFLQRRLQERVGLAASQTRLTPQPDDNSSFKSQATNLTTPSAARDLTMYEVSRVLSEIMEDVCQPFYYTTLGLDHRVNSRKAMKHVNKLLLSESTYRRQRCTSPWISLFIWAVLQNRREMSLYFWKMTGESVLSALAGCKILRELSKLETETETKLSMKELAQTFENLAHDVFSECYQSNEKRSFKLLIRQSPIWGGATCLQMATAADARLFFSHDGVQTLLSEIWWGDMDSNTEVWKLVFSFFLPPFIYTKLINFKVEEKDEKAEDFGQGKEFDSTDGAETADMMNMDEDVEECNALRGKPKALKVIAKKRPFIFHRWRQFWFAPVTSFLGNVLMYFLFLFLFAYVLLIDFKPPPPDGPAPLELVLYFWVFTLVCEEIRQSFFVGSTTLIQRMKVYIQDIWNKCDITALGLFVLGLLCRMFPWTYNFGRAVMCVDYTVFTLRLIHIFAVHKQLGPKIIIVGKMVKDVFFFLFFLGVWLMAYGVANQALLYSYDSRPGWVVRRVFYRPYMHIYGQIPLDEIDADKRHDKRCTDNVTLIHEGAEPCPDSDANWLVLILLSVYLLVTNILLVNLLIAMFSYTFNKVQERSDVYWKFQRYNLIVEYHSRPCLAPPFIIISHLHIFIKRVIQRLPSVKSQHFMLDLTSKETSLLNTWELSLKENLLSTEGKKKRESDTERLKRTSTKVDSVLKQMVEIRDHDRRLRKLESEVEYCSTALSWIVEALSQSDLVKQTRPPPLPSKGIASKRPTFSR